MLLRAIRATDDRVDGHRMLPLFHRDTMRLSGTPAHTGPHSCPLSSTSMETSSTKRTNFSRFCGFLAYTKGRFTHSMPFQCRAHAVPLSCRATKGLQCVFPIWLTQCGRVWFTLTMPRPCHSSQGHGTARPSRKSLWTNCQRSASSDYHAEFEEVVIRRIPISDAGGQCETKHCLSWTRKRVVETYYKKDYLLHCWTSSRIFPATMRTFTKDTALSEQGRGAA